MSVKLLSVVCHLLLGSCVTRSVYYSLRASSPIWTSEASRARTRERAAKPQGAASRSRVSSRVPLARVLFTISPKWRACSQAMFTTEKKGWIHRNHSTVGGRVVTLPDKVAASQYLEKQLNTFLYKKTVNCNLMLSALEYL